MKNYESREKCDSRAWWISTQERTDQCLLCILTSFLVLRVPNGWFEYFFVCLFICFFFFLHLLFLTNKKIKTLKSALYISVKLADTQTRWSTPWGSTKFAFFSQFLLGLMFLYYLSPLETKVSDCDVTWVLVGFTLKP